MTNQPTAETPSEEELREAYGLGYAAALRDLEEGLDDLAPAKALIEGSFGADDPALP